mgnify:CR=1 FL=1
MKSPPRFPAVTLPPLASPSRQRWGLASLSLSMLLAEMSVKPEMAGRHTQRVRRVVAELIPILSLLVIFLLLAALSASILPTNKLLVLIAVVTAAVAAVLWRWFIRVHTRMQVALLETLDNHKDTAEH